ncbi:MAG: dephospho-CoA kinase [Candidatus Saganbacteria bacterium]|nr:dephospho-CoA kinase [Candidatus Saganbacteria bacterium]
MTSKKVKVIGLTGPIGAGKDAVARLLRRRGAYIIDADKLAHEVYRPQAPAWHQLVRCFGSKVLMRGGRINRKKLGELVFADRKKLLHLNKIVHPYLRAEIRKIVESRKLNVEHRTLIVINAAVLKEIGLLPLVDEVWVITAPREIRLKRLVKHGLSAKEAKQKIGAQVSAQAYARLADIIINNSGTLKQLSGKIQARLKF